MVMYILWSAFAWTLKGVLYTCRFLWVSPYYAIKCPAKEPCKGCEKREVPGGHERSSAILKRLSKAEKDIQALKVQLASERALWEKKFSELQKKQQDLRKQLISETLARTGVFVREGGLDDQDGFEENGSNEKDHDTASSIRHSYQHEGSDVRSSRRDTGQSSSSGSQLSLSAFGSRPTSGLSSATSAGSWRSSMGPHRVFVPHSPLDLQLGLRVRVLLASGRISTGTIRYLGNLQGEPDFHLGVELEIAEHGLLDGTHAGHSYFECKPGQGAFVPFNKLLMAWE
ncbi:uncharacterized protein LOC134023491 [Osmerus eperlanus]|uniref:uncharacterized protein LOC134023491 n=1 Tax=Osmerus eperlanus TaxID=29151 RepID=UPI002E154FC0